MTDRKHERGDEVAWVVREGPDGSLDERVACWVLVSPAPDLPGAWIGHVLDFDARGIGASPEEALDTARLAVRDVVGSGDDRTRASDECWARLDRALAEGRCHGEVGGSAADGERAALVVVELGEERQ